MGRSESPEKSRNDRKSGSRRSRSPRRREKYKREEEVKQEEDFDRRQEEVRLRRNRENTKQEDVKQETSQQSDFVNPFAEELKMPPEKKVEKQKPNLGLSGVLTADQNTYKGVVIKYAEPAESKLPKKKWRLYPFKGDELLKIIYLHRQTAYLVGRLAHVCEIPVDHPSCSKQHAALQFRAVKIQKSSGRDVVAVKPYIIDLDSSNGTFLNNQKVEPRRYYELRERDVIKFGFSTREYVLLHEKSDTQEVHESSEDEEDIVTDDEI